MYTRGETLQLLVSTFKANDIISFGPISEEADYKNLQSVPKEICIGQIKEKLSAENEGLSSLADVHPAWIVSALENESPRIIGIILRWLPSKHVRYILDNLPKKVKMSLPKLVESFAVPTDIVKLIKRGFERKFQLPAREDQKPVETFGDIVSLKSDDLTKLFSDLGIHELAMAFQNVEPASLNVLMNRMSVSKARALQQRMKDVSEVKPEMLKDAKYTILEVATDQEDVEKLLIEVGLAGFSKAISDGDMFDALQMKLEPSVSYLFKRYIDQYAKANRVGNERQRLILERLNVLSKAGEL